MSPAVSTCYWSIFERNLAGLADFAGSKFQRMANWPNFHFLIETGRIARNRPPKFPPSFDFFLEAGPVGRPLEFQPAKSANPTRFLSKIDLQLVEGAGDVF